MTNLTIRSKLANWFKTTFIQLLHTIFRRCIILLVAFILTYSGEAALVAAGVNILKFFGEYDVVTEYLCEEDNGQSSDKPGGFKSIFSGICQGK